MDSIARETRHETLAARPGRSPKHDWLSFPPSERLTFTSTPHHPPSAHTRSRNQLASFQLP